MDADFTLALQLLGIGMGTVFLILSFVVFSGNTLIQIVNRYLPAPPKPQKANSSPLPANHVPDDHVAAIVAAVDLVTSGKGKVTSINKK